MMPLTWVKPVKRLPMPENMAQNWLWQSLQNYPSWLFRPRSQSHWNSLCFLNLLFNSFNHLLQKFLLSFHSFLLLRDHHFSKTVTRSSLLSKLFFSFCLFGWYNIQTQAYSRALNLFCGTTQNSIVTHMMPNTSQPP